MHEMKKSNILIIDNHETAYYDFPTIFNDVSSNVYQADGIDNGLEIAERYIPDIIICSITGIELGKELIKNIISQPSISFLPIIYISSSKFEKNEFREIMNLGAVDFFPKDFDKSDLIQSVERRIALYHRHKSMLMDVCQRAFETENIRKKDHILITVGKKLHLIKFEQIVCITADKEYSKIRTLNGKSLIVRKSLKSWVEVLPANNFLRIHRKSIINVNTIERIEKLKSRAYVIYLKTVSKPLELSRRYSGIMRKTFSGNND